MLNYLLAVKMNTETIVMLVLLAIMVVVLVVLPMFTNKRRNKAINDLHSSLRPGDVIKTVGGIVGKIVEIKEISPVDKEMVIETGVGDNKTTLVFDIQAVYQVLSKVAAPAEEPVAENTENTVATETPAEAANTESAQDAVVTEEPTTEPAVQAEEAAPAEATTDETAATEAVAEEKPQKTAAPKKPRKSSAKK